LDAKDPFGQTENPGRSSHKARRRDLVPSPIGLAAAAICFAALAACGSASAAARPPAATALTQACNRVAAVLSDGPDPDVDPVGYALAQVQPLEAVPTQDASLKEAVTQLAQAYQAFYAANGVGAAVKNQVTTRVDAVNKICPGAAG
jgi:hypothetical protein